MGTANENEGTGTAEKWTATEAKSSKPARTHTRTHAHTRTRTHTYAERGGKQTLLFILSVPLLSLQLCSTFVLELAIGPHEDVGEEEGVNLLVAP